MGLNRTDEFRQDSVRRQRIDILFPNVRNGLVSSDHLLTPKIIPNHSIGILLLFTSIVLLPWGSGNLDES